MLGRYIECTSTLEEIYKDKDKPNKFAEFYSRLKPGEVSVSMSVEFDEVKKLRENPKDEANMVEFSDEEGYDK